MDDTAANRLILQETLASQGAIVTCAKSGEEAIDQCDRALQRGEPYRLVLLDCRMPGMDGIDTARELRSRGAGKAGRQPLLLMLTSDDLSNVRVRAHETGIDTYLVKPVKRAELLYMIDRTLRRQPPAAAASSMHAPASGTHNGAPATVAISRPRAILLADDAPDNRFLVRAFLKDAPYAIDEAEDGVAALEKFKLGRYGLVLMDIRMPRMDGYEATRAIREFEREAGRERTPVVALTASALDEAVRKALDAGCDAHIAKPVKKTALLTAIRAALGEPAAAAESPAAPPPR
ncbi:MAG: response regulator [Candidatus Binataceae bacterium]